MVRKWFKAYAPPNLISPFDVETFERFARKIKAKTSIFTYIFCVNICGTPFDYQYGGGKNDHDYRNIKFPGII